MRILCVSGRDAAQACLVVGLMVGLCAWAGNAQPADWPCYRGPNRNGVTDEIGWTASWDGEPKILWRAEVGQGFSGFAVAGGRAYTMGGKKGTDTVYCFDAETGKAVWSRSYTCPDGEYAGPRCTPTVDGKYVYTLSRGGHLNCFDAATGKVVWATTVSSKPPRWGFASSPFLFGSLVIVNVGVSGQAFNKTTGKPAWSSTGQAGYATPVAFQKGTKTALLMFSSKSLVTVNPTTGSKGWEFPWQTEYDVNAADPVVAGDQVFISSGYDAGCALLSLASDGPKVVWRNKNMRNHHGSTVLYKGALYGFDESTLRCLDLKTGEVKWSQGGLGKATLIIADGKLVILSENGALVIAEASPESFKELARAQVVRGHCWTAPVLANGRIYCRTDGGSVACVDVSGK